LSIAKSTLQMANKNLGIFQLIHMIWEFISLHTCEHHILACLTLGTISFKSQQVH
jgi:hypothetical protein